MVTYPKDWKEVLIGDIYQIKRGQVLATSKISPIKNANNKYPVYSSQTLNNGLLGYFNQYLFSDGITWTTDGANAGTTKYREGKFYCTNVCGVLSSQVGYANICMAEIINIETPKYVSYVGNPKLMSNVVSKISIILPPLPEQQAIASVLSDFDEHIDNLSELIEKKKAIRDGALEDLLSGRTRLDGFNGEWEEKQLKELCYLITKQTGFDYSAEIKPSLVLNKQDGVLPFIQNKDFEKCFINYSTDFYIPGNIAEKYPKILLDEVCLLISISGRIGNVGVFNNEYTAFAGGAVGIAKLFNPSLAEWCMYFLISEQGQKQIFKHEKVGAQHNLTVADVRNLKVQIPPAKEREGIVSVLKSMDEEIESFKIEKEKMIQIKEGAIDDLLTGRVRLKV